MAKKDETIALELDREIAKNLAPLCKKIAQESESSQKTLVNAQAKAERLQQEMKSEIDSFRNRCAEGFVHCVDGMQECALNDPTIDLSFIKSNLSAAFNKLDSIETIKRYVKEVLAGTTWQKLLDVQEAALQALYKGAKRIFDSQRYVEAQAAFCFLATLDSTRYAFWMGLGNSCFHNQNYQEAINAYAWAAMTDSTATWPHIYAANCFQEMNDYNHAIVALQLAQEINRNSQERSRDLDEALNQRITTLKQR